MDFTFSSEQEAFRSEVRQFLKEEVPQRWKDLGYQMWEETDESWEITKAWNRKLGDKGWLAMTWPEVYGGSNRSLLDQLVLDEEMSAYGTPTGVETMITIGWVCPTLLLFGTEEQKQAYLPRAAKGDLTFCLGYSEPDAGSDLASVQTTAEEKEDHFLINGQKVWTSMAHRADYCWLAARTDPDVPRHKGISMFVVDMNTPGITVRPIVNMLGFHSFNEVFFDQVKIPKDNMVGEKNAGWYQLAIALDFERSGGGMHAGLRSILSELVDYCKETQRDGQRLSENPTIRYKLAQVSADIEALRLICYRVIWMQAESKSLSYQSSASKVFGSELLQRLAEVGMEILGPFGQLDRGSKEAVLGGKITRAFLNAPSVGIGGGTSDILRSLIAMRGLSLPRK